jgi:transcriptional regulator of arginine metabolism
MKASETTLKLAKRPKTPASIAKARTAALYEILEKGDLSTQEEFVEELRAQKFDVTQSTISRDLRRIGAIKVTGPGGTVVYRLPEEQSTPLPAVVSNGLKGLLVEISHNGSMIVIHTSPGSASLVARHLDAVRPRGILGTIAGDDTIFVAPASVKEIRATIDEITAELS